MEKRKMRKAADQRLVAPAHVVFEFDRLIRLIGEYAEQYPEMSKDYLALANDVQSLRAKANAIRLKHSPGIKMEGV